jgi:hypothetical protein
VRKLLGRVDDGRLGRAIAGLGHGRCRWRMSYVGIMKSACGGSSGKTGVRSSACVIRGRQVSCSCSDYRRRGVYCKHIAAVALHELGASAHARSTRNIVGLLMQL